MALNMLVYFQVADVLLNFGIFRDFFTKKNLLLKIWKNFSDKK